MRAAIAAHDAGAVTLIVSKQTPGYSGNSVIARSGHSAPFGTPALDDHPALFVADTLQAGSHVNHQPIVGLWLPKPVLALRNLSPGGHRSLPMRAVSRRSHLPVTSVHAGATRSRTSRPRSPARCASRSISVGFVSSTTSCCKSCLLRMGAAMGPWGYTVVMGNPISSRLAPPFWRPGGAARCMPRRPMSLALREMEWPWRCAPGLTWWIWNSCSTIR